MRTTFNLRSFWKFLGRHRLYTAINIFGFSVSLAFVILLVGYSAHQLSFDQFQENKERVFLLANDDTWNGFGALIGGEIEGRYPEIEAFTRVYSSTESIRFQDKKTLSEVLFVDSTFFDIFSFALAEGDLNNLLKTKDGVYLSESFAREMYGTENPIGKELRYQEHTMIVEGIVKDFENSHFKNPDLIARLDVWMPISFGWDEVLKGNNFTGFYTYVMTRPQADLSKRTQDMADYFRTYYWPYRNGLVKEVKLIPLTDVYFKGGASHFAFQGNQSLTTILLSVAFLILFFAMINYINLSVAQSGFRAPEMGTRRLLGSTRGELFFRLILESVLLCTISFCLALLLAQIILPFFKQMLATDFPLIELISPLTVLSLAGGLVLLGILTGIIPAFVISRYKPIEIVKGDFKRQTNMVYSKVFIGFQYLVSIVLIGCTLVMYRQINYMLTSDVGFDTENMLVIDNLMERDKADTFINEITRLAGVEKVSLSRGVPPASVDNNMASYNDKPFTFQKLEGDSSFVRLMGFEILKEYPNASPDAVWLNETAVRRMELSDTVSSFRWGKKEYPIKGVLKDFHHADFAHSVSPLMVERLKEDYLPWHILVRISGSKPFEAVKNIEKIHEQWSGGEPFTARFLDRYIQEMYENQQRTSNLLAFFTIIAIAISALGILAMATYFIQQRSKEIAIRKVFGSTRGEVLRMLVMRFVKLVLVAFVIAVPALWFLMRDWLSTYSYRIGLTPDIFLLAGGFAVAVALLTVFAQSWKAASANPAETIKR